MILSVHRIITGALCLILVWTAPALALARTAPGAAGMMVICTGTGPVSIAVDGAGQPIAGGHICPDCAAAALGAVLPGLTGQPLYEPRVFAATADAPRAHSGWQKRLHARARAPPGRA